MKRKQRKNKTLTREQREFLKVAKKEFGTGAIVRKKDIIELSQEHNVSASWFLTDKDNRIRHGLYQLPKEEKSSSTAEPKNVLHRHQREFLAVAQKQYGTGAVVTRQELLELNSQISRFSIDWFLDDEKNKLEGDFYQLPYYRYKPRGTYNTIKLGSKKPDEIDSMNEAA